eukprot:1521929-Amphidinium_carterae.1
MEYDILMPLGVVFALHVVESLELARQACLRDPPVAQVGAECKQFAESYRESVSAGATYVTKPTSRTSKSYRSFGLVNDFGSITIGA